MSKRVKKNGYVYLLSSDNGFFKFGCTTKTPEIRCNRINISHKKYGIFKVINKFKSSDIFYSEKLLKWRFWTSHICASEFIHSSHDASLIKEIFNQEKENAC